MQMTWQALGGDADEIYLAPLKERCERDGLGLPEDGMARQARLHLHRGIWLVFGSHRRRSGRFMI